MNIEFIWGTEAEARAFVSGVQFVNDSACTVTWIRDRDLDDGSWSVCIEDEDEVRDMREGS